ncbi:MAG: nitrous oxide reductase family maturation protein NosD, partial [Candidatus Thorarchaeota archaeon]
MKSERKAASLLVSMLLVSLLLSFIPQTNFNQNQTSLKVEQIGTDRPIEDAMVAGVPHGIIVINGNDEFKLMAEAETWPGGGYEASPYIIEGFDFDLGGTNGRCIDISDTTIHFTIRNCSFTGATGVGGTGIYLWNVTNFIVSNNTFYNNYNGMVIQGDNVNGTIVDNEVDATGGYSGIYAWGLGNSLISANAINGGSTGLDLGGLDHSEIRDNTVANSTDLLMYLLSSDFVTISDNDFINGGFWGIYLDGAHNCTLIRNTVRDNDDGIYLDGARSNSIRECTLEGNLNGINSVNSHRNYVEFCNIKNNDQVGILIDSASSGNQFRWNVFRNNAIVSVFCDGPINTFDYNFYDHYVGNDFDGDGIGDTPHLISGSAATADVHPLLMEPAYPEWDSTPSDQNLEFGDRLSFDLEISPPIPVDTWEISNTILFLIDDSGTVVDRGVLEVGVYPIDVVVTNAHGLSLEGSFTVTVEDTTSPVWVSQIQDRTYSYGQDIEIQLIAWDLAGV